MLQQKEWEQFLKIAEKRQFGKNTISFIARRRLEMIGAKGLTLEQIKAKGRWRSGGGLMRYLQDNPMAQGLSEVLEEKEVTGEAEEDDGPPVLEKEV
ncbi:hypothetical protein L5515_002336 [Caenorhabditis briggsae]|uniref:Uncharacterized protein n=1 Tax=Caenorhabditis briggsae TaxID=6238 RepID=A0AAE9E8H2_CAEBR|nr:hypothetical protein L5515_002336 [Caenorhabditis briggsae]